MSLVEGENDMRGPWRNLTGTGTSLARAASVLFVLVVLALPAWASAAINGGTRAAAVASVSSSSGGPDLPAIRAATVNQVPPAPVQIDLCAKTGTATMPDGSSVTIWGFALGTCSTAGAATLPGPVLGKDTAEIVAGNPVKVNLYVDSSFPQNVSIVFPGQDVLTCDAVPSPVAPDGQGASPGNSTCYAFTPNAGTFLYEAGRNPTAQVPMGLYGALVVRPAPCLVTPCQAYPDANSIYNVEAVLLLSEIDPALNAAIGGGGSFNMLDYHPQFWLINGKSYPDTEQVPALAGQKVLLRYVNAGLNQHTMMLLGMHENFVAKDAYPLTFPYELDSETFASGSTADAIATLPASSLPGEKFPLYNRQLHLTNGDASNPNQIPGGMMTFISVPGPP
jgi:FtsP/CotA-like multicopper oxidase with cupredoxin domain